MKLPTVSPRLWMTLGVVAMMAVGLQCGQPSSSPDDIVPCVSDEMCDDGVFCNGVELCTNGVCTAGTEPCLEGQSCDETAAQCGDVQCAVSADCDSNAFCIDGACLDAAAIPDDLQGYATDAATGAQINFASPLAPGDTIRIESPTPLPGEAAAGRALDAACTCGWSVDPADAGVFTDAEACLTDFAVGGEGAFVLRVETECGTDSAVYFQLVSAEAVVVVPDCTTNGDCTADEICSNGVCVPAPEPLPEIQVIAESLFAPWVLQYDLRLTDSTGAVIPDGVTAGHFRIYENDVLIDLVETNQFVTPAANLPLRVMLVLDYTSSMRRADAIDAMVEAARAFVAAEHFTATHSLGVVEFHDRGNEGEGYRVAAPLTAADAEGQLEVSNAIPESDSIESGLSRVWDAVGLALDTLRASERQVGEVQAIVFLTDGDDTTSETDAASIVAGALEVGREVHLYPIGFGDVTDHEQLMRSMADDTAGGYFAAADAADLLAVFNEIALDLRGQWNLTYITPRNSGSVTSRIEFTWDGLTATHETDFDAGSLAGDLHEGVIEVRQRSFDLYNQETTFVLAATYMPRNIDRIELLFANEFATFVPQGAGGLLDPAAGWSLTDLGAGGYLLFRHEPLAYGAFGNLGTVVVPGDVAYLQVAHGDGIYASFPQAKTIRFTGEAWLAPHVLQITVEPEGAGAVSIEPFKSGYAEGDVVEITAAPTSETTFDRWSGDGDGTTPTVTIVMDSDKDVTATFTVE